MKHAALPDGDYDDAIMSHCSGNVTARIAAQSANGPICPFHLIWGTHLGASRPSLSLFFGCARDILFLAGGGGGLVVLVERESE